MKNRVKEMESEKFGSWVSDNYIPLSMMYFEYFSRAHNKEEEIANLGEFVSAVFKELNDKEAQEDGRDWQKAIDIARERSRNETIKEDWSKN